MADEKNALPPKEDDRIAAAATEGESNTTPTSHSKESDLPSNRKEPPPIIPTVANGNDDHSSPAAMVERSVLCEAKNQLAYPVGKIKTKARKSFLTRVATQKSSASLESNLTNSSEPFVSNISCSDDDSEMLRQAKRGIAYPKARRTSSFKTETEEENMYSNTKPTPRQVEEPYTNASDIGSRDGSAIFESFSDRGQRKLARLSTIRGRPLETAAARTASSTTARLSMASSSSDGTETRSCDSDRGQRKLARLSVIRGRPLATTAAASVSSAATATARVSLSSMDGTETEVSDRGQRKLARLSMIRGRPFATLASATAATARLSVASSADGNEDDIGTATTITDRGQTKLAKLTHSRNGGNVTLNHSEPAEGNRFVGAWFVRHNNEENLPERRPARPLVVSSDTALSAPVGGISTSDGLAVASLVTLDEATTDNLPVAEEMEQDEPQSKKKTSSVLGKVSLLMSFGVFVVVVVLFSSNILPLNANNNDVDDPAMTNLTSPDVASSSSVVDEPIWSSPEEYLKSLLPTSTLKSIDNDTHQANNKSSPQSRAFGWATEDPLLFNFSGWRVQQRFALATFYYATDGDTWANNNYTNRSSGWLDYDKHECQWKFSEEIYSETFHLFGNSKADPCNYDLGNTDPLDEVYSDLFFPRPYQTLVLPMWNGVGTKEGSLQHLAPEMFQLLPSLQVVYLMFDESYSGSGLHGSLPSEIGLCHGLRYFVLTGSQLSSTICSEIGQASALHLLTLSGIGLTGTIPSELGLLSQMHTLNLENNQLTGTVPTDLSNLVGSRTSSGQPGSLLSLDVTNTNLSGTFPDLLCGLTQIIDGRGESVFDCGFNDMCGCDWCPCV